MSTTTFLDAVKRKHGLDSDYQLAKLLGVHRQQVSHYRTGKGHLGDDMAVRVADLAGLDRGFVLASIAAERAQHDEAKQAWQRVAKRLASAAVVLVFSVPFGTPSPAEASPVQPVTQGGGSALCIM